MNITEEFNGVVAELLDRARLIREERGCDNDQAIDQAIDDGFYYTEDKAIVLAYALNSGAISWGGRFDWIDIDEMLRDAMRADIDN